MMRAVIVFVGRELVDGSAWWTHFLRPGFIHCFVMVESRSGWIKVELRYGAVRLTQLGEYDDVVGHYQAQGATVIETVVREGIRSPIVIRTCVGVIKAIVGIRSLSLTPWQLYQHLIGSHS